MERTLIFVKYWNPASKTYDGYRELFLPHKFIKLNKKSFPKFKEHIKKELEIEDDILILKFNHKSFEWKRMDSNQFYNIDGDEIGIVKNYDEKVTDDY